MGVYILTYVNRQAPIVTDPYCNTVHVGLSSWRYYLDAGPNSRAQRMAKSFSDA